MISSRKNGGFTVIELLTVIGIIGILAALIFPIVGSAKKRAKQAQCISNLNQIFVAVKQFQLDERRYPEFLAGPVQWVDSNGVYVHYGSGAPVPMDKSTGMVNNRIVALYPEYIDAPVAFACSVSGVNTDDVEYTTTDIVQDPMFNTPVKHLTLRFWRDNGGNPQQYYLYKYSSYDFQNPRGTPTPGVGEVHYCLSHLDMNNPSSANDPDVERQLRWKGPPADTVITWCSYHRDFSGGSVAGGSRDIVLFLDGRAKPMSSSLTANWEDGWRVMP